MESASPSSTVRFKKRKLDPSTKLDESYLMDLSKEELIQKILNLKKELARATSKADKCVTESISTKKKFDFTKVQMRPIALKILYQGFNYHGFQIQTSSDNTIAHHLLKALQKTCLIEDKEKSSFACCGRTDSGVSAFCQVVTLKIRSKLTSPGEESDDNELPYLKMLNNNLPRNIKVVAWSPVPEKYSARFDCLFRNYKYWFPQAGLDIDAMHKAAQYLVGTHDFRNLCKMNVGNGVVNFKRLVTHAGVTSAWQNVQFNDSHHNICEFNIRSQGFLWHQIRCIMSVLFLVGQGNEKPEIIQQLVDIGKKPVYPMVRGEPLNLYHTEFDNLTWHYDEMEVSHVLRDLHEDWSLLSIKATMLGEMIKDIGLIKMNTFL
ncbi:hypothetical protein M8J76_002477 [Diaphorina citri]|nr:hypothetical protein M8J76_002477 [Diaphorina citri]